MARGRKTVTDEVVEQAATTECFCPSLEQQSLLAKIYVETKEPPFFCYMENDENLDVLVAGGIIEVNEEVRDPEDENRIATRLTAKGKTSMHSVPANEPIKEPTPVFDFTFEPTRATIPAQGLSVYPDFAIVDLAPMPETNGKRRGKATVYPFDALEIGQSFFIPGEDAAKKHAPTVNSANGRYAVPDPTGATTTRRKFAKDMLGNFITGPDGRRLYTAHTVPATVLIREFKIAPVPDGAPWGRPGVKGAGVWRFK